MAALVLCVVHIPPMGSLQFQGKVNKMPCCRLRRPCVDKLLFETSSCPYTVILWLLQYPGYLIKMYLSGNLYKPESDV